MDNLPKRRHEPEFIFLTQNPSAAVSAKLHCRSRISFLNSGARSQIFPIPTCLWRGSRRSRQEDPSVPLFLKRQSAAFPILKKKRRWNIQIKIFSTQPHSSQKNPSKYSLVSYPSPPPGGFLGADLCMQQFKTSVNV